MRRILLACCLATLALPAFACELKLDGAWIKTAPPGAGTLAGYGTITNPGKTDAVLTGLSSPAFGRVELHEVSSVDGVMQMRPRSSVKLAPGASLALASGGSHLMLMQPTVALADGDTVALTMTLACDTEIETLVPVRRTAPDGAAPNAGDDHAHHDHSHG